MSFSVSAEINLTKLTALEMICSNLTKLMSVHIFGVPELAFCARAAFLYLSSITPNKQLWETGFYKTFRVRVKNTWLSRTEVFSTYTSYRTASSTLDNI